MTEQMPGGDGGTLPLVSQAKRRLYTSSVSTRPLG